VGEGLLDIETAREMILARAAALVAEPVPLEQAQGRVLAAELRSEEPVPAADNSAMDGFAVRSADLAITGGDGPAVLRLLGESRAGAPAERSVEPGGAIAISTGAVIPPGADAVVRVEDTRHDRDRVEVLVAAEPGQNIRRAGEDVEAGDLLLSPGTLLGPAELGVAASVGAAEVSCHLRPRITLISTGDELVGVDEPLRPGAVRNSNLYSLTALARAAGAEVAGVAQVPDRSDATREAVARGLESDVLVVSGGVSVGEHDHVKSSFDALGVEQVFWRVSLKPGKPAWFGTRERTPVFGLPGNPVSAYVTFLLFVRPALRALQGADPGRDRTEAVLAERYEKPADRAHAVRCRLRLGAEGWIATAARQQGSHVMTSLLGADALAVVPAERTVVEAGERVEVELIGGGHGAGA
jgi:molybdopterin molybdotransferase